MAAEWRAAWEEKMLREGSLKGDAALQDGTGKPWANPHPAKPAAAPARTHSIPGMGPGGQAGPDPNALKRASSSGWASVLRSPSKSPSKPALKPPSPAPGSERPRSRAATGGGGTASRRVSIASAASDGGSPGPAEGYDSGRGAGAGSPLPLGDEFNLDLGSNHGDDRDDFSDSEDESADAGRDHPRAQSAPPDSGRWLDFAGGRGVVVP